MYNFSINKHVNVEFNIDLIFLSYLMFQFNVVKINKSHIAAPFIKPTIKHYLLILSPKRPHPSNSKA